MDAMDSFQPKRTKFMEDVVECTKYLGDPGSYTVATPREEAEALTGLPCLLFPNRKLGKGAYGTVFAGRWSDSGKALALKLTSLRVRDRSGRKTYRSPSDISPAIREALFGTLARSSTRIMASEDTRVLQLEEDHMGVYSIMPMGMMSLHQALYDFRSDPHFSRMSALWLLDCLRARVELHELSGGRVKYMDLKTQNFVLVPESGRLVAKMVDFGSCRLHTGPDVGEYVTVWYRAPELFMNDAIRPDSETEAIHACGEKTDVWSFGVMILEFWDCLHRINSNGDDAEYSLLRIARCIGPINIVDWPSLPVGFFPVANNVNKGLMANVAPWIDGLEAVMGTELILLLKRILSYEPSRRPTFAEILAHPYFQRLVALEAGRPTLPVPDFVMAREIEALVPVISGRSADTPPRQASRPAFGTLPDSSTRLWRAAIWSVGSQDVSPLAVLAGAEVLRNFAPEIRFNSMTLCWNACYSVGWALVSGEDVARRAFQIDELDHADACVNLAVAIGRTPSRFRRLMERIEEHQRELCRMYKASMAASSPGTASNLPFAVYFYDRLQESIGAPGPDLTAVLPKEFAGMVKLDVNNILTPDERLPLLVASSGGIC